MTDPTPIAPATPAETRRDYEITYDNFWREIVEPDGVLNTDQLKRELHDYHDLLDRVPKVYCHVTDGLISKANANPEAVKRAHDDAVERWSEEAVADAKKEWDAALTAKLAAAEAEIAKLRESLRWRDVKVEPPPNDVKYVLLAGPLHGGASSWRCAGVYSSTLRPSHWMPLPPAPERSTPDGND